MVDIEKWTEIAWAEQANGRDLLIPTEVFFELIADLESATAERDRLRAEAELLRMQLAACGVVAMSNTPESAGWSRDMHPDYMSASCQDVMRAVDREMALRAEVEALRQDAERYRWLRDGASEQSEQSDPWDSVGHIQPPLVCLKPGLQVAQTGDDLDSAIDAAMAAKEGE